MRQDFIMEIPSYISGYDFNLTKTNRQGRRRLINNHIYKEV